MTRDVAIEKFGRLAVFDLECRGQCFRCVGDGSFAFDLCPDCMGTGKQSVADRSNKIEAFK